MNRLVSRIPLLAALLLMCAAATDLQAAGSNLDDWADEELLPYLVRQLRDHPRFRGEPLMVVALNGTQVQGHVDGLTADLRARMDEALRDTPGLKLAWQPVAPLTSRAGAAADCIDVPVISYYIGIQTETNADGSARIRVRALDIAEREWVSGFGSEWSGRLTRQQRQRLADTHVDVRLRGQRQLPFAAQQMDLAADALAQKLACRLAQGVGAGNAVFLAGDTPASLMPLARLVLNHLARDAGLRPVGALPARGFVLRASEAAIDEGLVQWWMLLEPVAGSEPDALPTVSVMTYAAGRLVVEPGVRLAETHADAPAPLRPPPDPSAIQVQNAALFSTYTQVWLAHGKDCGGRHDWLRDAQNWNLHAPVRRGDCFIVRHDSAPGAVLFRVVQDVDGRLWRAAAGRECGNFEWAGKAGYETHYAFAVAAARASRFADLLSELPARCGSRPRPASAHGHDSPQRWLERLDRALAALGESADWQAIKLQHAAAAMQARR